MADQKIISELKYKISHGNFESYMLGPEQRYVGPLRNGSINNLEEQYLFGTDIYTETYQDANQNTIVEKSFHKNDVEHETAKDYYKVRICTYKVPVPEGGAVENQYYFEDDRFVMPYAPNDVHFSEDQEGLTINILPRTDYVEGNQLDIGDIQVLYGEGSTPSLFINTLPRTDYVINGELDIGDIQVFYSEGDRSASLYMENSGIFKFINDKLDITNPTSSKFLVQEEELHYITETKDILVLSKKIINTIKLDQGVTKNIVIETITNHLT